MSSAAFHFGVILTSSVLTAISASSLRCISCPCGTSSQNYTHCVDESVLKEYSCERWSQCQACQHNTTSCVKCPPNRIGLTCSEISEDHVRRKRQDEPNFLNYPRQSGPCPFLERPESGSIQCTQTGNERNCTSLCLPGYHFEGEENVNEITLRCRRGVWTPRRSFPACRSGGHCEVRVTGAGYYNCTIDMEGTHCDITCNGWPQGRFHCYPGRRWNPPLPHCTVPKEQSSCRCQNGGICDVNGRCTCPEGMTGAYCEHSERQKATCRDPGTPRGGSRLNTDGSDASFPRIFEEGESVIFTCNGENFALKGSSFITCRADGTWSAYRPRCIESQVGPSVYCPDPGYLRFGSRNNADGSITRPSTRYTSGQSVEYFCNEGYQMTGNSVLTCLASGRWSSILPSCEMGPFVSEPPTGRDPPPVQTPCRHPGVDMNGIIKDHPLLNPQVRGQTFPPGTELSFDCNEGFEPEGATILFCLVSGEWTSPPPTCRSVPTTTTEAPETQTCKHPGVDVNGRIEDNPLLDPRIRRQTFPVGTELTFSCNAGFEPEGATTILCLRSGDWTSNPPRCRSNVEKLCPIPEVGPNAEVEEFFFLNLRILQGFDPGMSLTFRCKEDYELEGKNVISCLESGQWSDPFPTCNPIPSELNSEPCPAPEVHANSEVEEFFLDPRSVPRSFKVGTELTFRCKEGYVLEGLSTIRCILNRQWSSPSPTCQPRSPIPNPSRTCENPGTISNGRVEIFPPPFQPPSTPAEDDDTDFAVGTHLKYICDEGFDIIGADSLTCESSGFWSESAPICEEGETPAPEASCERPGTIENGIYEGGDSDTERLPVGTVLTVQCKAGTERHGARTLRCLSPGQWSAAPPTCITVTDTTGCGRSFVSSTDRITHGNQTIPGEWPWTVAIAVDGGIVCGGALLDKRTVLTAAHCLTVGEDFTLYFGKFNRSVQYDDEEVKVGRSYRLISHPNFNSENFDNDIAIVKFEPDVSFSVRIQPVCLPNETTSARNVVPRMKGYVTGWGMNENQLVSKSMMMAQIPVQSNETCIEAYQKRSLSLDMTSGKFCAGYRRGITSICRGDSGSPMVFFEKESVRHILEGIVSFGIAGECVDPEKYTVFTKVSHFMPWILRNWGI